MDLANDAQRDAATLNGGGRWRAALNRCYYSLFSRIAAVAAKSGYTMPLGWEGPRHEGVYAGGIVSHHLGRHLKPDAQSRLIFISAVLYKLRRDADYSPSTGFTEGDSRLAFGRLLEARSILEGAL
ncbi:MAG: hypothetical protein IT437_05930 [Phycisphaerales bacterium]|nr:hypothetical protein [Phycisphaerales bacterium]